MIDLADDLRERIFPRIRDEDESGVEMVQRIPGEASRIDRDWNQDNLERRNL